jgi:ribosomal protein L37AE/L43A
MGLKYLGWRIGQAMKETWDDITEPKKFKEHCSDCGRKTDHVISEDFYGAGSDTYQICQSCGKRSSAY